MSSITSRTRHAFVALLALPLFTTACGDADLPTEPDAAGPLEPGPDAGAVELVHVEVHTDAAEVFFHDRSGVLFERIGAIDGVVRATVPRGSTATAGRETGVVDHGDTSTRLRAYETVTALDDGDVVSIARRPAPLADLPTVSVTLPPPPVGATRIAARGCGDEQVITGAVATIVRTGCASRGELFVAGDPAPRWALTVPDLGDGAPVDLRSATWAPLTAVEVRFVPAPGDTRFWTAGSAVVLDGAPRVVASPERVFEPGTVPMLLAGDGATVDATLEQSLIDGVWATDSFEVAHASAAPLVIDATVEAFPQAAVRRTGPRGVAFSGQFGYRRDQFTVVANVTDAFNATTWTLQLRGFDRSIVLPTDCLPDGDIETVTLSTTLRTPELTWTRALRFRLWE